MLIYVLYFFSGASALAYQQLWLRQLSHVYGVTIYAASTVLAAFMGGLALGSLAAGRIAPRMRSPLAAFGLIEVAIGSFALATPYWLDAAARLYDAWHTGGAGPARTAATIAASAAVLLVPTSLMGATLPTIARVVEVRGSLGTRLSWLYGANTAGAIAGTLATGYWFIGGLGMTQTLRLAAATNIAIGLSALAAGRWGRAGARVEAEGAPESLERPLTSRERAAIRGYFVISGFAALALEVVWFRVLVLFLHASSYAFATMLATVLGGIAAGSYLGGVWLRRRRATLSQVGTLQLAIAITAPLSLTLLAITYAAGWRTSATIQGSLLAIAPAAALMGAAFPLALRLWTDSHAGIGRSGAVGVGSLNALNLFGAIAGALVGGFLLVPLLGSRNSLLLLSGIYAGCGVLLLQAQQDSAVRPRRWRMAGALASFAVLAWVTPDPVTAVLDRRYAGIVQVSYREEGAQSTVNVLKSVNGHRYLYLDGLDQANDTPDMLSIHRVIGHLPMLLHPDPRRALVVGLGGGATVGAVSLHGAPVDLVELSPAVVRGARFFGPSNYQVLDNPVVTLIVNDGRNHLRFAHGRYDVITADIIQPTSAGAGALYSVDYFRLARRALTADGLMLQWIGERPRTQYTLLLRTFQAAFPDATLWAGGSLLVGSTRPLTVSSAAVERRLQREALRTRLEPLGLGSVGQLTAAFTAGPGEIRAFAGPGPLLSDDRPLLEYNRSLPSDEPIVMVPRTRDPVDVFKP